MLKILVVLFSLSLVQRCCWTNAMLRKILMPPTLVLPLDHHFQWVVFLENITTKEVTPLLVTL